MALFLEAVVRERAAQGTPIKKTASEVLYERMEVQDKKRWFHIFMSHSFEDRKLVLGTVLLIEDMGFSVYLDWRDDPLLDRTMVTSKTARVLRSRLVASASLFYATTANAISSRWMPWELGYKDGHNSRCAILPVVNEDTEDFVGQEYLGIYPYVSDGVPIGSRENTLWIHRSAQRYLLFEAWIKEK